MFLFGSLNACRLFDLRRAAWFTVSALLSVIRQNSLICNILLLLYCNVGRGQNWRRRSKHKKPMTSLRRHSIRRHVGGIAYLCERRVSWAKIWKFLCHSYLQTMYFDWFIIPLTTVCKHAQVTTSHCCSIVYFQHGGGNYCKQNNVTVTTSLHKYVNKW